MKRLLFTRVGVEIIEDTDFPEDPAPYVRIFTHDPEFTLELEEAADLGRALVEWVRDTEERERRQERERRRKELEPRSSSPGARAQELEPAMTLLEIVTRSRGGRGAGRV
jgi:hypothetical protein